MKMCKITAVLSAAALLLSLTACSAGKPETTRAASTPEATEKETAGHTLPYIGPGGPTAAETTAAPTQPAGSTAAAGTTESNTEAPTKPTEPMTQATEPSKTTEAETQPTEGSTQPTEAPTQPTEAPTQPTEPPAPPTEEPTQPPEPPTEPDPWTPTEQTGTGYLICIDPGHQEEGNYDEEPNGPGSDVMKSKVSGGTSSYFNRDEEYKVVLAIGFKLRDELESRGYEVIMTRTRNDVDISNVERAQIANEANADAFVRLHCNSSPIESWNGTSVICQTPNNPYNGDLHDEFRDLCYALICAVTGETGLGWDGIIERDDMTGINWCRVPTCLLEMAYMSNEWDDERIQDPDFQDLMARAIADGIDDFLAFRAPREHYPGQEPATKPAEEHNTVPYPTAYDTDARYTGGTNGLLICIDAGHQARANNEKEPIGPGSDETKAKVSSGTQGRFTGVAEYEVNLKVAFNLERELIDRGYSVLMIRSSNDVNISNVERATIANEVNADAFIRVHCNGVDNQSVQGAGAICQTRNNPFVGHLYNEFFGLCNAIVKEICAVTGQREYGVITNDAMSGINWCQVPTALIEMGFMTNEEEDNLLVTEQYQQDVAVGMANGIDRYFGR